MVLWFFIFKKVSDRRYFISVMSSEGKNFIHMSSNNGLSRASKADATSMPVTV